MAVRDGATEDVRIESCYHHDMCIAVDYERGDGESMLAQTCYNGELVLRACDAEYGTEWYFMGGQLVNSLCWGAGLSSVMTVFFEDGGNTDDVVRATAGAQDAANGDG